MVTTNVVVCTTGRVRPVCGDCGRKGRAVEPRPDGQVSFWSLANGWTATPFPASSENGSGSLGTLYQCPACDRAAQSALAAGEAWPSGRATAVLGSAGPP